MLRCGLTKWDLQVARRRDFACVERAFGVLFRVRVVRVHDPVPSGADGRKRRLDQMWLRGCVVIDKTFLIMALACAMAPFLGAGVFLVVHLF